jgi:hypothetical protein
MRAPQYYAAMIGLVVKHFLGISGIFASRSSGFPMFKIRSIAARLILAISLTVAVACAILGGFSIAQQRSLTRLALDQQLKLQYDSVIAAVDYEGRTALAVSSVIAALPPVGEAIAKGDRDALAALLGDANKALNAQGIPLITFQVAPATSRAAATRWSKRSGPANRSSAWNPGGKRSASSA